MYEALIFIQCYILIFLIQGKENILKSIDNRFIYYIFTYSFKSLYYRFNHIFGKILPNIEVKIKNTTLIWDINSTVFTNLDIAPEINVFSRNIIKWN